MAKQLKLKETLTAVAAETKTNTTASATVIVTAPVDNKRDLPTPPNNVVPKNNNNPGIYKVGFFLMLFFLILSHIVRSFM